MNPTPEQVVQAEAEERAADAPAVMRQARDALHKTMAAWGGTCAWHADVKAAIAALDAYAAGVKEPLAVKVHAYGGSTGINDYLMTDGTVKAMRPGEVQWAAVGVEGKRNG